jgi:hypothetical protein
MAKASRGQGWVCQLQEARGHEKICVIISVLEDQQTLRFIVFCMLEKLCGRTNTAPYGAHPLYRLPTASKRKIYQSEKRKVIGQTTLALPGDGEAELPSVIEADDTVDTGA